MISSILTQLHESLEELETKIYTNLKWTLIAEFTKLETVTVEDLSKFNEIMLLNCGVINNKEIIASTIVPIECFKNNLYIIANYNNVSSKSVRIKYVSDTSISCIELKNSEKCEVYCR